MRTWFDVQQRDVLTAARTFSELGLRVAPVGFKAKKVDAPLPPSQADDEQLRAWFQSGPRNLGIMLGEPSAGLVDVDLDCDEALRIAPHLLPPTPCLFGHAVRPCSHWLYYCVNGCPPPAQFKDLRIPRGTDRMVAEIRSTGDMTVFPPSVHPSGEAVRFDSCGRPAGIDGQLLSSLVRTLAAAAVMSRTWPCRHGIHACAAIRATIARWPELACPPERFVRLICIGAQDHATLEALDSEERIEESFKQMSFAEVRRLIDPGALVQACAWACPRALWAKARVRLWSYSSKLPNWAAPLLRV